MATKKITKIISTENGDNYVADIEGIENRISQNSSNLETAKQELTNKCNETLSQAKAYTDTEKQKYIPLTGGLVKNSYVDSADNSGIFHLEKETGAMLYLCDTDSTVYKGGVILRTVDKDTHFRDLQIKNDGSFTWDGKNIVRSVNGANADNNGNVQLGNVGAITGEIKWFAFNTVPDGYIICNGAKVSRTTYADLFAAIGTSFGSGDGSTTFDLPDLIDKFAQGSRTVGTYKGPGLPNITGELNLAAAVYTLYEHQLAFKSTSIGGTSRSSIEAGAGDTFIKFNANDGATTQGIYRDDCSTVQPPTLTLLPCIKY